MLFARVGGWAVGIIDRRLGEVVPGVVVNLIGRQVNLIGRRVNLIGRRVNLIGRRVNIIGAASAVSLAVMARAVEMLQSSKK